MKRLLLSLACLCAAATSFSQTVNGLIGTNEYGNHTDGQNAVTTDGVTWYMSWDDNNLYVAIANAAINEAAVLYIDAAPTVPVNAAGSGTFVGYNSYDGTSFNPLPFGAEKVIYFKDGYHEYRSAQSGGWSTQVSNSLPYSNSGTTREISIPWSTITGGGKPAAFNFFGYITSSGGFVYGPAPTGNSTGFIGTAARYPFYYTVSTDATTGNKPFARRSYVFNDAADINSFGAFTIYDLTMNTAGRYLSRGTGGGNWTINGSLVVGAGTIFFGPSGSFGSTTVAGDVKISGGTLDMDQTNQQLVVAGNVDISGGTLELSDVSGGGLTLSGNFTRSAGTFTHKVRTVTFQGTGTSTMTAAGGELFGSLSMNKTSGGTLQLASNATVSNVLTLTNGTLHIGSNTLNINGSSISRTSGVVNGGTGTVAFGGSSALTVPNSTFSTLNNLTVNNAAGVTFAGSPVIGGNLALTAGTLTAGSNTIKVAGNITRGTGSLLLSTGTLELNGSSAQTVASGAFGSDIHTLNINNSASGTAVTLNGTAGITNTLRLTDGELGFGANALTINQGAQVQRYEGSLAASPTFAGDVDITYAGTTAAVTGFELPSGNIIINLTLNNPAGITLDKSITVLGTLTLTSGRLSLGAFDLAAYATSGASASSYVRTSGTGSFSMRDVNVTPVLIPVGNSTYNPLEISSPLNLEWTVRVDDAISNVTAPYAVNLAKAINRQWNITPSVNPVDVPGATIRFYYNGTTDAGASFSTAADNVVWHYYGGQWASRGTAHTPVASNGMYYVEAAGLTYFSPYAIANIGAPLPVSLLSFSGKRVNNRNELKWVTASESNNRGFEVERSLDGRSYVAAGFVASRASNGNSTSELVYTFNDAPSAGGQAAATGGTGATKWYYRLKQVDLDGRTKYSSVVKLTSEKNELLVVDGVYPNPSKNNIQVRLQAGLTSGNVVLQLSDMAGRIVSTKSLILEAGAVTNATITIEQLPAGVYHLKAVAGDGGVSESIKVVKQ